jgi:hypothetical protein
MLFAGGMILVFSLLIFGAWMCIWLIYGVAMAFTRPSRSVKLVVAIPFLALTAIPPLMAKRSFDESMNEFAQAEAEPVPPFDR